MRSQLSNEIFQDELLSLYQKKICPINRCGVCDEGHGAAHSGDGDRSVSQPGHRGADGDAGRDVGDHKGKKVYGYLKKPAKAQVDAIVDELAKVPEVAECYEQWNQLRDELERYYKDAPREHLPLSRQKEFKAIKNMVIREAEQLRLGTFTFEDARMRTRWMRTRMRRTSPELQLADGRNLPECQGGAGGVRKSRGGKAEQVRVLEQLWQRGFTLAAYQLGKCWRDGRGVLPDDEQAELWFRRAADAGYDFASVRAGKTSAKSKPNRRGGILV